MNLQKGWSVRKADRRLRIRAAARSSQFYRIGHCTRELPTTFETSSNDRDVQYDTVELGAPIFALCPLLKLGIWMFRKPGLE